MAKQLESAPEKKLQLQYSFKMYEEMLFFQQCLGLYFGKIQPIIPSYFLVLSVYWVNKIFISHTRKCSQNMANVQLQKIKFWLLPMLSTTAAEMF